MGQRSLADGESRSGLIDMGQSVVVEVPKVRSEAGDRSLDVGLGALDVRLGAFEKTTTRPERSEPGHIRPRRPATVSGRGEACGAKAAVTGNSVFEIQEVPRDGWARLLVTGELDVSTALTFRRRLRALRAKRTHVYVDLSQLEFIDCAGAHALNDALTHSQEGDWRIEVAPRLSDPAKRFFDLMTAAGVTPSF